uniref:18 kDa Sin3-associated polypeptide n=1 Tax=Ditylenchus dipsaci TaxID=166011 RepID=A0A915CLU8_9BILA
MAQVISQVEALVEKTIDREKACPLLLRIFCANGRHNQSTDYARGSVPPNELQIYTWMDCSLRELMSLIKDVNPDARRRGTEFNFSIVSPDRYSARYVLRDIGKSINGQRGVDDTKTLGDCKFEVGDFIDVAIILPSPTSNVGGAGGRFGSNGNNFGGSSGRRMAGNGGSVMHRSGGPSGRYRD